jgi:predicted Zn-dependent peptidase
MSPFARARCRSSFLVLAVLAALALPVGPPPVPGSEAALRPGSALAQAEEPGIFRRTLPNGILVITRERPNAEVAALSIYVRGGSRDEDPETVGAAHFMEHMFFQGTPSRPSSAAIEAPVTERGGWLNATTAWEGITFFGTVPNAAFDVLLDTLSDILVNSVFDADALEKERRVVVEELNRNLNSPSAFAFETYAKTVFADHPAHQMPGGDRGTVRSVTRDTLLHFRDRYFRASNLVVAAVGNLHHEEVEAQVAAAFAAMPTGPAPAFTPSPRPETKLRKEEVSFGARQAQLILGWPTVGFDSPDRYALEVLATALGSSGQVLAGELRDRLGLVTRVDTGYWALTDAGTWLVAAAAEPDKVDAAVAGILDEIRTVRDTPLDAEDLANAKAYVRGSTRRGLQRSIDQAQELSTSIALGYYQPIEEYLAKVADVTADDVQRVARTYLDPDNYTLAVLGP